MGDLEARGLHRLKAAEQQAAAIIAAARARKTTRLKHVKAEAEVEIAAYREHRETHFQLFAEECTGISSTYQRSVAKSTEEELASVALKVSTNKQAMIESLLQSVTTVVTETPRPILEPAHVKPTAPIPSTAAGLLENDQERALHVRDRFTEADSDNSGTLDNDEVVVLIGTLCADVDLAPPRVEKVAQLMAMCDTDKSGLLDLAEFDKFFQIVLRDAAKRANKLGRMDSEKKLASVK